ncbi:DNA polymerase Y family protein [Acidiphilium sp. PA]|uniref:Y-family DNA polymerase n=1 Tax=Acidiphilium sp. PA TaxID=2871705 RepID=UPI002242E904|nr:DNA polymerase Y family protein [Acidiphilium sp. PA]MCW8307425.1 DNA polymerase Y family protein [Acidiphilium sp. PA]
MHRRLLSLWFPGITRPPDPAHGDSGPDEPDLYALALWCQAFTPLTAVDPPDGVLLDITGCAHLFGGEAGLRARLAALWPQARLAIADTAAAAWALARYGQADTQPLAGLPLAALRVPDGMIARLRRLGIRRIGELAALSRGEIRAGFGADLSLRLDRLFGRAPEAMLFLSAPASYREVEYHAEPLLAAEQLQAALARLAHKLCAGLAAADLGLVGLKTGFHRIDARVIEERIGFAAPTRDAHHVIRLLCERLQAVDPGFGVEAIVLSAETAPLAMTQPELGGAAAPHHARTIDRLMRRVRLSRFAPDQTHIPEFAAHRVPVTTPESQWSAPSHPRPLRLFERPEPIAVIAPVPDDPPRMMQWRGGSHRVVRATGPERIARDWWRHDPPAVRPEAERVRDYYVIEDEAGQRFWVFRAGLHAGEAAPRWFIHGLF